MYISLVLIVMSDRDEQLSKKIDMFHSKNYEQMRNCVGVEHWPDNI